MYSPETNDWIKDLETIIDNTPVCFYGFFHSKGVPYKKTYPNYTLAINNEFSTFVNVLKSKGLAYPPQMSLENKHEILQSAERFFNKAPKPMAWGAFHYICNPNISKLLSSNTVSQQDIVFDEKIDTCSDPDSGLGSPDSGLDIDDDIDRISEISDYFDDISGSRY